MPDQPSRPIITPRGYSQNLSQASSPSFTQNLEETPKTSTEPIVEPTRVVAQPEVKVDFQVAMPSNNNKEKKMAEVDTMRLSDEHSDIRREQALGFGDTRYDIAERTSHVNDVVKDSRYETVSRVENAADRLDKSIGDTNFNLSSRVENAQDRNAKDIADFRSSVADRFFALGCDAADNRAQINALGFQVRDGFAQAAALTDNAVLKSTIEGQRNTQYLSDKITLENEKTRNLINDLKYHDLNRALVERNAELVEEREGRRYWRHHADQNQYAGQWAAVQSQLQAFASQLQETRQGMVNFGTMAGVGQTSTSNNVR